MKIKGVRACELKDTRGDKTILVSVKTNVGLFSASSPTGKSTGKHEKPTYKKSLEKDIEALSKLSDYFKEEIVEKFDDLRRIEDLVDGHIGANTTFALESAILKALASEQKIEIWQLINKNAKKFPRFLGNVIGGSKHSEADKKPDFQEFLIIPKTNSPKESYNTNITAKKATGKVLPRIDKKFKNKKNDENAWMTSLNEREILTLLRKTKLDLGLDIAASSFYKRKKYKYQNPPLTRTIEEQLDYVSNLIKNYTSLIYLEDPFDEEDFESFAKLLKKHKDRMIVGDDLTVTSLKRLKKAIEKKSINAIIIKPNQCGKLTELKDVVELARKNSIKIIFSHRSGETKETILADLAFGFGADFFKCGIEGDARTKKLERLVEIEKSLK
jgi:enolase